MEVKPFDIAAHMVHMCKWLYLRDAYIPSKDEMPAIGYIAYSDNKPVAVAFLRKMEGNHALLDGIASNPDATSEERHQAIDMVMESVVNTAKELKIKSILGYTRDESTFLRSIRHGFVQSPHAVLVKDLSVEV